METLKTRLNKISRTRWLKMMDEDEDEALQQYNKKRQDPCKNDVF